MARDSTGPQGQPGYAGTGVPQDAADLSEVANYAAMVGNRRRGTTAQRQAALSETPGKDTPGVWEGLIWGDTTDGNEYRLTSGAWVLFAMSRPQAKTGMLYAGTTNPNTGNSGYSWCDWTVAGGFCEVNYNIYLGTGSSVGSGYWGLILPIAATPPAPWLIITGQYIRANGTNFSLYAICDGSNMSRLNVLYNDGGTRIGSTTSNIGPGDRLLLHGVYPVISPTVVS